MIMQQNGGAFFGVIPILPPVYRGICHAKSAKPEDVFEFSMHTEGKEEPSGQFFRGNRQHNLQAVEGNHNTQQQCPKSAPAKPTAEHARQSAFSAFKATAKKQQPWIFSILPNLNPWIFSIFGVLKPWIISNSYICALKNNALRCTVKELSTNTSGSGHHARFTSPYCCEAQDRWANRLPSENWVSGFRFFLK